MDTSISIEFALFVMFIIGCGLGYVIRSVKG